VLSKKKMDWSETYSMENWPLRHCDVAKPYNNAVPMPYSGTTMELGVILKVFLNKERPRRA
jgi:hypothetical protein